MGYELVNSAISGPFDMYMMIIEIKISVILIENFLGYFDGYVCLTLSLQLFYFLYKFHFDVLPSRDTVLGGNN